MKWKTKLKTNLGFVMMSALIGMPRGVEAQKLSRDAIMMLQAEAGFRSFFQSQDEFKAAKQKELVSVPHYNLELDKEIHDFHLHIRDMHFRHVQCKICREHVKNLRRLSQKIESAMK